VVNLRLKLLMKKSVCLSNLRNFAAAILCAGAGLFASSAAAADADLAVPSFIDLAPMRVGPGEGFDAMAFSIINNGPGGNFSGNDVTLKLFLSVNDMFGDGDDILIGQVTSKYPLGLNWLISTNRSLEGTSIVVPADASGEYEVFLQAAYADESFTDPTPANNVRKLANRILVGRNLGESYLVFDGLDDVVQGATIYPNSTTMRSFTAEAWVFPRGSGILMGDDSYYVIVLDDPQGGHANDGVGIAFGMYDATGAVALEREEFRDLKLNEWNHVAVMFNAGSKAMTIAINGKLSAVAETNPAADLYSANNVGFILGDDVTNPYPFWGYIDEVRIWPSVKYTGAFTPARRFTHSSSAGASALYHFDELHGATALAPSLASAPVLMAVGGGHTIADPRLAFTITGADMVLTWDDGEAVLEQAPGIDRAWGPVTTTSQAHTNPVGSGVKFFRLKKH